MRDSRKLDVGERSGVEASGCHLDPDIWYFTRPCLMASRNILIPVTLPNPASKRGRSHSENTT